VRALGTLRGEAGPAPGPCSGVEDGDLRGVEAGRIGDGIDVRNHTPISIDMATVDSGAANRDDSLRSQNFFDAANHPRATFRSTEITAHGSAGTITGVLTIKGITRSVTPDVEYLGHARDPWGNDRAAFRAATIVNREEWGLTVPTAVDAGGVLVSKDIRLEIETELFKG